MIKIETFKIDIVHSDIKSAPKTNTLSKGNCFDSILNKIENIMDKKIDSKARCSLAFEHKEKEA